MFLDLVKKVQLLPPEFSELEGYSSGKLSRKHSRLSSFIIIICQRVLSVPVSRFVCELDLWPPWVKMDFPSVAAQWIAEFIWVLSAMSWFSGNSATAPGYEVQVAAVAIVCGEAKLEDNKPLTPAKRHLLLTRVNGSPQWKSKCLILVYSHLPHFPLTFLMLRHSMGDAIKYLIPEIVNTGNAFRSTKVIKHLKYGVVYYKSMSILDHLDKLSTKEWGGVYDSNIPCRIRRLLLDKWI